MTVALAAHAPLTVGSLVNALQAEVVQAVQSGGGAGIHVAAVAPVAAVGTALGHKLFTAEGDAAVASLAGLYLNGGFIHKFHMISSRLERVPPC